MAGREKGMRATVVATIANAASLSGAVVTRKHNVADSRIVGIGAPVMTAGTDQLVFEGSEDGVTYTAIFTSAGTRLSVKVSASVVRDVGLTEPESHQVSAWPFVRVQAMLADGTTPQAQTGAKDLRFVMLERAR